MTTIVLSRTSHLMAAISIVVFAGVGLGGAAESDLDVQIRDWLAQLGSNRFEVREHATNCLVDAGPSVTAPLRQWLAEEGGVEGTTRALTVLRELSLQDRVGAEEAEAVLRELASHRITSLSQRARVVLDSLEGIRAERARKLLLRLGAILETPRSEVYSETARDSILVELGAAWRGTHQDLKYLGWLGDNVRLHVTLRGDQFRNDWVEGLVGLSNLVGLTINRTLVTDEVAMHLRKFEHLELLVVAYVDVSNAILDALDPNLLGGLHIISIYGTQITKTALDELQGRNPNLTIRYRRGGFLGVRGTLAPGVCEIESVNPNEAADRAGLRPRDIVLKYRGVDVQEFSRPDPTQEGQQPTLAELISLDPAGEHVDVTIQRGDQMLTKEVILGEWP